MKVTIDRFEGDYAVCEMEGRKMVNIEKAKIPSQAKEGDILEVSGGKISSLSGETGKKKTEIEKLMNELWE